MNERTLLKTIIEYLKYEDIKNKNELLTIFRNSKLILNKTNSFASKNMQFWENVELRIPIPMLGEAKNYQKQLYDIINYVYEETDDYDFNQLFIKPKIIESENESIIEHDVLFDEIKNKILQGIRGSKYIIWAAVAWFTDKDILNELVLRKRNGVNIRIITSDEKSNNYLIDELKKEFDTLCVPCWGENSRNRIHDKFCIIDFEYVMHGSYNWTKNAQNNEETLSTALDRDFVKKFMDKFISLYNEYKKS